MSHRSQLEAALLCSRKILQEEGFVPKTHLVESPTSGEFREYKGDYHQLRVLREHPDHRDEKHAIRSHVSEILRFGENGNALESVSRRLVVEFTGESSIASDWKIGFSMGLYGSYEELKAEFKSKLEEMNKFLGILFPL